jgi:hypothetical protein
VANSEIWAKQSKAISHPIRRIPTTLHDRSLTPTFRLELMPNDLIQFDLTDRERTFICDALYEWRGAAGWAPLPIDALGLTSWDDFDSLTDRLRDSILRKDSMTELDWTRALFLAEITWASSLVGAGPDFETITGFSDAEALRVLRSIQRKIATATRANLLFPGRQRPRPEEFHQESERILREGEQGRPTEDDNRLP